MSDACRGGATDSGPEHYAYAMAAHVSFPNSEIFSFSVIRYSFEFIFSSVFFERPQTSMTTGGPWTIV